MDRNVPHSLVQSLRSIPDFAALDDARLLAMAGESMNLAWKAGSIIFSPGDEGAALYVILDGECSISGPGDGEVAHPVSGDSFGEMSLLLEATHSRTAKAVTDCEILVLPKAAFNRLIKSHPDLAAHFEKVLASRQVRPQEPAAPSVSS